MNLNGSKKHAEENDSSVDILPTIFGTGVKNEKLQHFSWKIRMEKTT
jgi:hypothetical protein